MKRYTIKPEFLTLWGEDCTTDTVVDTAEVERLATEWGKPVEELLEQLEEAAPASNTMKFTGYIDSDFCTFTVSDNRLTITRPDGTEEPYNEEQYDEDSYFTIRSMLMRDGVRDLRYVED